MEDYNKPKEDIYKLIRTDGDVEVYRHTYFLARFREMSINSFFGRLCGLTEFIQFGFTSHSELILQNDKLKKAILVTEMELKHSDLNSIINRYITRLQ